MGSIPVVGFLFSWKKQVQSFDEQQRKGKRARLHWSLVTSFWVALVIVAIATVTVVVIMQKPVWIEIETLAGVVGVLLSGFYTFVLYHGVYFAENETITLIEPIGTPMDFADAIGEIIRKPLHFDHFTELAGEAAGPIGLLLGFILDLLVCFLFAIGLGFLFWLGVNFVVVGVIAVTLPLFYIFKRSVLFVIWHVEECHGNLWRSLSYGVAYAALKTGWMCLIVFASHKWAHVIKLNILN
jgi:Flp pilus assembly protein TadB